MSADTFANAFVVLIFAGLLVAAAATDVRQFRIPNGISLAVVALFPIHVLVSPHAVGWGLALGLAALVLVAGVVFFSFGWVGGGDAKLMTAMSLWAGPALFLPALIVTALAGGVLAVVGLGHWQIMRWRAARLAAADGEAAAATLPPIEKTKLPYGVAIAAGGLYVAGRLIAG